MTQGLRKNGHLEVKFNDTRTQAIATIYPPKPGGEPISALDVLQRLKAMGVVHGIREQSIKDAVHLVQETNRAVGGVIVAQAALPQDGSDARVHYHLSAEILSRPLPKRADGSGLIDWFSLNPENLVKADQELATIVPAQPGIPGKSLTWPIQDVPAKSGKPASLQAGQNVRLSDDGMRLCAVHEGYVCLHGDQILVHAVHVTKKSLSTGTHTYPAGVVFLAPLWKASIHAGGFVAMREPVASCQIHAKGDVFVTYAEDTTIITPGSVYVFEGLRNCTVNARRKIIALGETVVVGGSLCATEGAEFITLGASDFTETTVTVGIDQFTPLRSLEIQEEMTACEANIVRISQALKPFTSHAVQETLTDDRRHLLSTLQAQKRFQEARINELHNERRLLSLGVKERQTSSVTIQKTVHPGVWIRFRDAATQVETPQEQVRFAEGGNGKWVQAASLKAAA